MVDLEARIKLVKDIKRFAIKELGIAPNDSFRKVAKTEGLYVIYVSKKERIEMVADGAFPNKKDCNAFQRDMQSQGFEIFWGLISGWGDEDCPITQSLIKRTKIFLTETVLHENFHIHCDKSNIRLKFCVEEAVADFFAYKSALDYFQKNDKRMITHVKNYNREAIKDFNYIKKVLERLETLYKKDYSKARGFLRRLNKKPRKLLEEKFRGIRSQKLNNAYFLYMQDYAPAYGQVFEALEGLRPLDLTKNKRKLYARLRERGLK